MVKTGLNDLVPGLRKGDNEVHYNSIIRVKQHWGVEQLQARSRHFQKENGEPWCMWCFQAHSGMLLLQLDVETLTLSACRDPDILKDDCFSVSVSSCCLFLSGWFRRNHSLQSSSVLQRFYIWQQMERAPNSPQTRALCSVHPSKGSPFGCFVFFLTAAEVARQPSPSLSSAAFMLLPF